MRTRSLLHLRSKKAHAWRVSIEKKTKTIKNTRLAMIVSVLILRPIHQHQAMKEEIHLYHLTQNLLMIEKKKK